MVDKKLEERYRRITRQLEQLFQKTENEAARMATIASLLHHKMPKFLWTGFYVLSEGQLTVGPYQGPLACLVLEKKKGVCWTGILEKKTINRLIQGKRQEEGLASSPETNRRFLLLP